jgi:soluble lytic murein transglycosylase-like protein
MKMKTLDKILCGMAGIGLFILAGAGCYAHLKGREYERRLEEKRQVYAKEIEEIRREESRKDEEKAVQIIKQGMKQEQNQDWIYDIIDKHALPEERDFYRAIIKKESKDNSKAVSRKGARGLMQIMPDTWKDMTSLPFDAAFESETNVEVGIRYFHQINSYLSDRISGWENLPEQEKLMLMAAAYNGGMGRLVRAKGNINAMPKETREYVPAVMKEYRKLESQRK